ncbi:hypothetical protein HB818_03720 [Listeria booriae]|uniref:hypothetical protein n=1 Tax=Listeria booriae TaxID=1552123 RepID=UPI0016237117|nr:hypothetical protein [Listeria booriae]MBC1284872.1 hypothetical protein [Listeria booriae]
MNEVIEGDKTKEEPKKRDLGGWAKLGCAVVILALTVSSIVFIFGKIDEDERRNNETVGAYIEANLINADEKLLSYTYDKDGLFPFGYELYVVYRSLSDGKVSTHSKKVEMASFEDFAEKFREKEKLRKLEKAFDD